MMTRHSKKVCLNLFLYMQDSCSKYTIHRKPDVSESPIDITKDLSSVEVVETQDATFSCELSKAGQEVTWFINGNPITTSDKYQIVDDGQTYKLIIKDCRLADAAEVSIVAKDCKCTAQLLVNGR